MKINSIQVETPTSASTVVGSQADGTTAVFTIESIREGVIKKYRGLIYQESTFAPELTDIENSLTSAITCSRVSTGVYHLACADFINNKTFWNITPTVKTLTAPTFINIRHLLDNQTLELRVFTEDAVLADEALNQAAIGIEIY